MSVETLLWIKHLIDYVAGAADEPPLGAPNFVASAVFCGVTSLHWLAPALPFMELSTLQMTLILIMPSEGQGEVWAD